MMKFRSDYRTQGLTPLGFIKQKEKTMKHIKTLNNTINTKRLAVKDVAKKAGITSAHLYNILRGDSPITPHVALGLESALGTNARRLFLADATARFDTLKGTK